MEWFRTWIYGVCVAAVLVSVAKSIAAKNTAGRYVSVIGSVVIVCAMLSPFKSIDVRDISKYRVQYDYQSRALSESLQEQNERIKFGIIEKELSAYILERAEQTQTQCTDARVTLCMTEDDEISVKAVELTFSDGESQIKKQEFKALILEELDSENVV